MHKDKPGLAKVFPILCNRGRWHGERIRRMRGVGRAIMIWSRGRRGR